MLLTALGTAAPSVLVYLVCGHDASMTCQDVIVNMQVTFGGGAIETFPNADWQKVRVKDDIAT